MRASLARWIADADTRLAIEDFKLEAHLGQLNYLDHRSRDLYYSLVGELFDMIRENSSEREAWATLGRAFSSVSRNLPGPARRDSLFFSSAAFYCGGFPASAILTMRATDVEDSEDEVYRACHDLLTHKSNPASTRVRELIAHIRDGTLDAITVAVDEAQRQAHDALHEGPDEWVAHRLYATLLQYFQATNLRAVLPNGGHPQWNPLITSFLGRRQPIWEFFPSQIEAIKAGLLTNQQTYTLQMPTGAGKTALTETLLFSHLLTEPDTKAALLVPYRALARELRQTIGRNLPQMGIPTRTVYGGTVPTPEEGEGIDNVQAIIATPEALIGLLDAHPEVTSAISLVVCDEGHLLANGSRGVALELLLARLRGRNPSPRIVFVSAIVPNVEEINAWLGGTDDTVVRSDYRPALAEYAVLRSQGAGRARTIDLELQELSTSVPSHTLPRFLQLPDFQFVSPATGRTKTYNYGSKKTQAIAAARKALAMGTVAVFAATKTGNQGVIGLAEELIKQVDHGLPLPLPAASGQDSDVVNDTVQYLRQEYGPDWTGTKALQTGAVVHHGDLPQETREVLEELLSDRHVSMVLCTSTLAEGVNLPIRTLVLYSISRRSANGETTPMLARDIKNLVGRTGRAGSTTRGLVICANEGQWQYIRSVADGAPGEPVEGALIDLLRQLESAVARLTEPLGNGDLEFAPQLFSLVDGIDATLVEFIHEELDDEASMALAESLASGTFAARQANEAQRRLLRTVFRLRASRMSEMRSSGRLALAHAAGGRPRLVDSIIDNLYPHYDGWSTVESPLDPDLLRAVLQWAWEQPGFANEAQNSFSSTGITDARQVLGSIITMWLEGRPHIEIAAEAELTVDQLLRIHTKIVLFDFVTLAEQAVAVLEQYVSTEGGAISAAVAAFPEHLRYGVPTETARNLMAQGVRHRRAAVELGTASPITTNSDVMVDSRTIAHQLLEDTDTWSSRLGSLIFRRTVADTASADN